VKEGGKKNGREHFGTVEMKTEGKKEEKSKSGQIKKK
jgi:hypothetical protein